MGAKKDKDKDILKYKRDEQKRLAKAWKKYNISQQKIDKVEAKQAKYEDWLAEVTAKPDY
jgi:hypothetical protein